MVGRCLYGVDINPMAADLAKVSLWLTAMTPGKPLSFLDHHIKVGNALLGTTPALLRDGIPDAAFTALTGDDKAEVTRWKKANKAERANRGGDDLFSDSTTDLDPTHARAVTTEVDQALRSAATLDEVTFAAQRYATLGDDPETQRHRLAADAWCAAFLGEKTPTLGPDHHRRRGRRRRRHRRRDRPRRGPRPSRPGTGSSTGTWSSPRSSASPTAARSATPTAGPAVSTPCWATRPGSPEASGEGVLRHPRCGHRRTPRTPPPARRLIAALEDDEPCPVRGVNAWSRARGQAESHS